MKTRINENTKITLTIGQLKKLVNEVCTGDNRVWHPFRASYSRDYYLRNQRKECLHDIESYIKKIDSRPDIEIDMDALGEVYDNGGDLSKFLSDLDPKWDEEINDWWYNESGYCGEQLDVDSWAWEIETSPAEIFGGSLIDSCSETLTDVVYELFKRDSLTTKTIAREFLRRLALDFADGIIEKVRPEYEP